MITIEELVTLKAKVREAEAIHDDTERIYLEARQALFSAQTNRNDLMVALGKAINEYLEQVEP